MGLLNELMQDALGPDSDTATPSPQPTPPPASDEQSLAPLTDVLEWRIRAWFTAIGETDREEVEETIERCRHELAPRQWCLIEADRAGITLEPTQAELGTLPRYPCNQPKQPGPIPFAMQDRAAQAQWAALQMALFISRSDVPVEYADLKNLHKQLAEHGNSFNPDLNMATQFLRKHHTALHVYPLANGAWWKFSTAPEYH